MKPLPRLPNTVSLPGSTRIESFPSLPKTRSSPARPSVKMRFVPKPPTKVALPGMSPAPKVSDSLRTRPRACTHKIAIGDSDLTMSALAPFADSSRTSPEVREVPRAVVSRCSIRTHYSITSSARVSRPGGISRPSALAVLTLIDSTILVGNSTGRSPGCVPRRILSTK
jgi:hypothetical protein